MMRKAEMRYIQPPDLEVLPEIFRPYEKEETRLSVGSAGKIGQAQLTFEKIDDKTYLTKNYNQVPARALRALYYDPHRPDMPYIIFVNPTGGVLQGDRYQYEFRLEEGAEAFVTENTATKLYKMDLNYASRRTDVHLSEGSRFEYLPRETIAFAESRWFQDTVFHVTDGCQFLYSDLFCPGRVARDEFWDFSVMASKFRVEKDGRPVLVDNALWTKEDKPKAKALFGGYTFLLNMYWYSSSASAVKSDIDFRGTYGGATNMSDDCGIIIKALSNDLEELRTMQLGIWDLFRRTEVGTPAPDLRMN
jgi:urease accessory protein